MIYDYCHEFCYFATVEIIPRCAQCTRCARHTRFIRCTWCAWCIRWAWCATYACRAQSVSIIWVDGIVLQTDSAPSFCWCFPGFFTCLLMRYRHPSIPVLGKRTLRNIFPDVTHYHTSFRSICSSGQTEQINSIPILYSGSRFLNISSQLTYPFFSHLQSSATHPSPGSSSPTALVIGGSMAQFQFLQCPETHFCFRKALRPNILPQSCQIASVSTCMKLWLSG